MHLFEKKVIHPNETASALDSIQLAEAWRPSSGSAEDVSTASRLD
jgi:hypothetical protein